MYRSGNPSTGIARQSSTAAGIDGQSRMLIVCCHQVGGRSMWGIKWRPGWGNGQGGGLLNAINCCGIESHPNGIISRIKEIRSSGMNGGRIRLISDLKKNQSIHQSINQSINQSKKNGIERCRIGGWERRIRK